MSLTKELLNKSEKLTELTDDQISAIVGLSVNDEEMVIGARIGKVYGDIDKDIIEATGLEKPKGVKTYDWIKTLLLDVKKVKDLKDQIKIINEEKSELEVKITKGEGLDDELKSQLEKKDKKIKELSDQMSADKNLLETKTKEFEKANFDLRFNFLSSEAEKELKFIDALPESTIPLLIKQAKSEILEEYEVDSIDDGKGGKKTVFKKDGVVSNNPDNGLNPYTLGELYRLKLKDSLSTGKKRLGTGSRENNSKGQVTFSISGAKTQVEADEAIAKQVMSEGIARESAEYQPRVTELRNEHNVSALPIRG